MISGVEDTASIVRCIEAGAEDFLPKPFDPVILRARIGSGLNRKRVRDLEQDFVPDYDAQNMPSGDNRAAYALEHIAFRVGRIEQSLARIAAVIESALKR